MTNVSSLEGGMMRKKHYNLVFYGEIALGYTIDEVKRKLSVHFNTDISEIDRIFADEPFIVKENVDYKTALKSQIIFEWMGAICHIESPTQDPDELFIGRRHCNVIFDGKIDERYSEEDVKKNLKELLHLNERGIEKLFASHPVVMMRDVDYHPALKIQTSFELAGAKCRVEMVQENLPATPGTMICPHCGFKQRKFRMCKRCGVYIEKYHPQSAIPKARQAKRSIQKRDAAMKKELFNWGVGFIILGVLQFASLGLWAFCIIGVGMLNLLIRRRPLFIVDGISLFVSGSLNLVLMTTNTLFGNSNIGVYAGAGQFELVVVIGFILLVSIAQMYAGVQGFNRFKKYASTKR